MRPTAIHLYSYQASCCLSRIRSDRRPPEFDMRDAQVRRSNAGTDSAVDQMHFAFRLFPDGK